MNVTDVKMRNDGFSISLYKHCKCNKKNVMKHKIEVAAQVLGQSRDQQTCTL